MTPVNLGELRLGRPGCPSELALDRLAVGSTPPSEAAPLREHVEHCESCSERLALRRQDFAGFPEFDARKPLRALHEKLAAAPKAPRFAFLTDWLRGPRWAFAATGAAALAVLAIIIVRSPAGPGFVDGPTQDPTLTPDHIRIKGELALHIYKQVGQTAKEMMSGDRFHPGDNLRFAVDLPRAGYISIIGVDASGRLYLAWPLPEHMADTQRKAGRGQELQGGGTLDESLGEESLYLVQCSRPDDPSQCRSEGAGRQLSCPAGCSQFRFSLQKVP